MKLTENVYIVAGKKRTCIYDLNKGELYNINHDTHEAIRFLLGETNKTEFNCSDLSTLQNFLKSQELVDKEIEKIEFTSPNIDCAFVEVTTNCNHKCIHCYNSEMQLTRQELTMSEFSYVIDELVSLSTVKTLKIIGGEPLFIQHKKLMDMLSYIRGKFETIEILSNLSILSDEFINHLKSFPNIKFTTTLFSTLSSEFDKCAGINGAFSRVYDNILKLKNAGIRTRVNYIPIKNISKGNENLDIFDGRKDYVRLSGKGNLNLYNREILSERLISEESFSNKLDSTFVLRNMHYHNCFSHTIYIDIHLDVYPCNMERRIKHGNIRSVPLKNVIKTDIALINKDTIDGCKDCEYRYACFDCRPDTLDNTLNSKPWFCTYNPASGEWQDKDTFINNLEITQNIKL